MNKSSAEAQPPSMVLLLVFLGGATLQTCSSSTPATEQTVTPETGGEACGGCANSSNKETAMTKAKVRRMLSGKTFKITAEDIRNGLKASTTSCPVAHSIRRRLRNDLIVGCGVEVDADEVSFVFSGQANESPKSVSIPLPQKVQDFINTFDSVYPQKRGVKPILFKLVEAK